MGDIERIAKLLSAEDEEVAGAAALVLGELGAKAPAAVEGLCALAESGSVALRLRALDALTRIAPKRAERRLLGLLEKGPLEVRRAAGRALAALGPGVVKSLRGRMEEAGAEERRIISEVLSGVGGEDAFSTLLSSLSRLDGGEGRQAALAARQTLRTLPLAERKKHLAQVKQFLRRKETRSSVEAMVAAVKLLGFLELGEAIPLLVDLMSDEDRPLAERLEAVLGLRFALGAARREADRQAVVPAILSLVDAAPEDLSRAAQDTLAFVSLGASAVSGLKVLAAHRSLWRARFAVQALGSVPGEEATEALAELVTSRGHDAAQEAAAALRSRPGAGESLGKALCAAQDPDRAWTLVRALEPHADSLSGPLRTRLTKTALDGLDAGAPAEEAHLRAARLVDPARLAAGLRERVAAARRKKDKEPLARLLRILTASPEATDEDRFALAVLELRGSGLDLKRQARERDPALAAIGALAARGYDVAGGLARERDLSLEAIYYVGFHLAEEDEPGGEALLELVMERGGRKKIAQAARNKLKLVAS